MAHSKVCRLEGGSEGTVVMAGGATSQATWRTDAGNRRTTFLMGYLLGKWGTQREKKNQRRAVSEMD